MMKDCGEHFSQLAPKYIRSRTTDKEPVLFIQEMLRSVSEITAADLGCGAGRYDSLLLKHSKGRMTLFCCDSNQKMLEHLVRKLGLRKAEGYHAVRTSAAQLPMRDQSLDCLFSFNSVHLFPIRELFREASRLLKQDGYFFIYTRFRSQNERNIWGQRFPLFAEKEKRLYELRELEGILGEYSDLFLGPVQYFRYGRSATLKQLVAKARNFHYSTFCFYAEEEFERSLQRFQQNISAHFNPQKVTWHDENVMLVVRKRRGIAGR